MKIVSHCSFTQGNEIVYGCLENMERRDLCLFFFAIAFTSGIQAMSRQQLKNSGKMFKKQCMGKNDVTEEEIGDIEKGKFIEERNVMCYIACVYQLTQVVKNNKLNYEASIKQVNLMYPPELKESARASIEKCRDIFAIGLMRVLSVYFENETYIDIGVHPTMLRLPHTAKKYKDLCEASYWTAKCMYEDNPKDFVFA